MKKLYIIVALLITSLSHAGTYTSNYNLYKPASNETGLTTEVTNKINPNWTTIDSTLNTHETDITALELGATANVIAFDCNGTDDTATIAAAIAEATESAQIIGKIIKFPSNQICNIASGKLTLENTKDLTIEGSGSHSGEASVLYCSDSAITECILLSGWNDNLHIKNLQIKGPGKAVGTTIDGISTASMTSAATGVTLENVVIQDFSGEGFYSSVNGMLFDTMLKQTCFKNIGLNGFIGYTGQTLVYNSTGCFNSNIDGAALWAFDGHPKLTDINNEAVGYGVRLGKNGTEGYGGAEYSHAVIQGLNIEPINSAGYGVYSATGSSFSTAEGIACYAKKYEDVCTAPQSCVYWEGLTDTAVMFGQAHIYEQEGCTFAGNYFEGGASANGALYIYSNVHTSAADFDASIWDNTVSFYAEGGKMIVDKAISAKGFTNSGGAVFDNTITITSADSPYSVTDQTTQHIIKADATSGNISISFAAVGSYNKREFLIKRIDTNSSNSVEIADYGTQKVDGQDDPKIPIYGAIRMIADETAGTWHMIGQSLFKLDNQGNATFDKNITATTFIGALTGNATTSSASTEATLANDTTDATFYIPFAAAASGTEPLKTVSGFTINPNSGDVAIPGDLAVTRTQTVGTLNVGAFIESTEIITDGTATNTLTASECGKTIILKDTTPTIANVLPVPTAGCKFTFILNAALDAVDNTVTTNASAAIIVGNLDVNSASEPCDSEKVITFVGSADTLGDWVDLISDGTNWYVRGHGHANGGITCTAP